MTIDQARAIIARRTFKNYCMCGGYAWQMNGRPEEQPHMDWCPQKEEYAEYRRALSLLSHAGGSTP
jgi:hypothetical protein